MFAKFHLRGNARYPMKEEIVITLLYIVQSGQNFTFDNSPLLMTAPCHICVVVIAPPTGNRKLVLPNNHNFSYIKFSVWSLLHILEHNVHLVGVVLRHIVATGSDKVLRMVCKT